MTVIAYKAGRMACDALCVDVGSGTTHSKGTKIKRTKAGALIGQSGDADARAFLALMDGIKNGEKIPSSTDLAATRCEGNFLVAFPNGEVWQIEISSEDCELSLEWMASAYPVTGMQGMAHAGCGGELALAFMRSGKSAKEAVAAVCDINAFCAPPIYEEALHRAKKKPASKKAPVKKAVSKKRGAK